MAQGSFKIGRLYGIDIEVHWTLLLLLLFALLASGYSFTLFILVVLLFACVLVHELSHSLVAKRNGVNVREIVLNIIGGASVIDTLGIDPDVEFRISVVGPLMSLFVGGVAGIMVIFAGAGTLTYVLQFLFEINIILGVFNMIPAFPMDGGRVLRSWLRKTRGEYKATMTTARVSHWITALVVLSLVYVLSISGSVLYKEFYFFIFLIIAVFLYWGTQAEMESATMKKETSGLKVSGVLSRSFVVVSSDIGIGRLYRVALEKKEHIILTWLNGRIMIVDPFRGRTGLAAGIAQLSVPIKAMKPSTSLFDAMSMMDSSGPGIGAVVSGGKVIGIVTQQRIQAFIYLHMLNRRGKRKRNIKGE